MNSPKRDQKLQLMAHCVPVTDPALRLLVLTQILQQRKQCCLGLASGEDKLPITPVALADISMLSLTELAHFSKAVSPQTIAINVGDDQEINFKKRRDPKRPSPLALVLRAGNARPEAQLLVADASIKTMVITQLLHHVEAGLARVSDDCSRVVALPCGERQTISALEALSRSGVFPTASMQVSVDLPSLAWEATRYRRISGEQDMFEYFVRAHASTRMLLDVFKATPSKIRVAQERLSVSPRVGRCVSPTESDCLDVLAEWSRLNAEDPRASRELYYALHQRFKHLSMAQLYGVVKRERKTDPGQKQRNSQLSNGVERFQLHSVV